MNRSSNHLVKSQHSPAPQLLYLNMSLPTRPATGHATADERDARARDRRSTTTGARPQLPNRPRTAPAATHAVLSRHLRQSNGETFCVDPRLFVYVPAKKCSRRDCVFCGENHFHRGPACDCVRCETLLPGMNDRDTREKPECHKHGSQAFHPSIPRQTPLPGLRLP